MRSTRASLVSHCPLSLIGEIKVRSAVAPWGGTLRFRLVTPRYVDFAEARMNSCSEVPPHWSAMQAFSTDALSRRFINLCEERVQKMGSDTIIIANLDSARPPYSFRARGAVT
jgi:hypothetical protein